VNIFVGLIVSLLCALLLTPEGGHPWQVMPRGELWIFLFFLIQQPLGMILWDVSTRRGDIVTISLLADFAPWIALATSVWFLNVSLSPLSIFAAVLLVTGAVISRLAFLPAVAGR
jgi:drug/metabolite transporter (DMT)-like permease